MWREVSQTLLLHLQQLLGSMSVGKLDPKPAWIQHVCLGGPRAADLAQCEAAAETAA